jgi:hypothetical protein
MSLYRLFFTQRVQKITNGELIDWVQIELSNMYEIISSSTLVFNCSDSLKYIAELEEPSDVNTDTDPIDILITGGTKNNIVDGLYARQFSLEDTFFIEDEEEIQTPNNIGYVEIKINRGGQSLQTNTLVTSDSDRNLSEDAITLRSYKCLLPVPLKEPFAEESYYIHGSSELCTLQYPVINQGKYYKSKWHYEYRKLNSTVELQTVIGNATVDRNMTLDQELSKPFAEFTLYEEEANVDSVTEKKDFVVEVVDIPKGVTLLNYYSADGELISSSYAAPRRGYLPARRLASFENMLSVGTSEVGWSILGAHAIEDTALVYFIIEELIYIWETLIKTSEQYYYGLPSTLPRIYEEGIRCVIDKERSVYQNAWLGYCICVTLKNIYKDNSNLSWEAPKKTLDLLLDLAKLCVSTVVPVEGYATSGYFESTFVDDRPSILATVVLDLFLSELLDIYYTDGLYRTSIRIRHKILFTMLHRDAYIDLVSTLDNTEKVLTALHSLLWSKRFNYSAFTDYIISHLKSIIGTGIATDYYTTPVIYCILKELKDERLNELFNLDWDAIVQTGAIVGEEEIKGLSEPELMATAVNNMITRNYSLYSPSCLEIKEEMIDLRIVDLYQKGKNLIPYGEKWFSESASKARGGKLGNILYTTADQYREWWGKYILLLNNSSIGKAETIYALGIKRKLGYSDLKITNIFSALVQARSGDYLSIITFLNELFPNSLYDFVVPQLPEVLVDSIGNQYIIKKARDLYSAFKDQDELYEEKLIVGNFKVTNKVKWEDYAGRVLLRIYEVNSDIIKYTKEIIGAGVNLEIEEVIHGQSNVFPRITNFGIKVG